MPAKRSAECLNINMVVSANDYALEYLSHYMALGTSTGDKPDGIDLELLIEPNFIENCKALEAHEISRQAIQSHRDMQYVKLNCQNDLSMLVPMGADTHRVLRRGKRHFLVMAADELVGAKILLRLIRSILVNTLQSLGWIYLHSAAVVLDGNGILLCGPIGVGKTSLLLTLMRKFGAEFFAGDRVLVKGGVDEMNPTAPPLGVRFIQGGENKDIENFLASGKGARHASANVDNKLEITPKDLCQLLNRKWASQIRISDIFLINQCSTGIETRIVPALCAEAQRFLDGQILAPSYGTFGSEWVGVGAPSQARWSRKISEDYIKYSTLIWAYPNSKSAAEAIVRKVRTDCPNWQI